MAHRVPCFLHFFEFFVSKSVLRVVSTFWWIWWRAMTWDISFRIHLCLFESVGGSRPCLQARTLIHEWKCSVPEHSFPKVETQLSANSNICHYLRKCEMPVPRPLYCCKDVLLDYPNPYKNIYLPTRRFWDQHFLRPDIGLFCNLGPIIFQNWDHSKTFSKPSESVSRPPSWPTIYGLVNVDFHQIRLHPSHF